MLSSKRKNTEAIWLRKKEKEMNMIFCDSYVCDNCGCEFYYPTDFNPTDATLDHTVRCPKCGSTNCNL